MEENIIMAPIRGRSPDCSKNLLRKVSVSSITSSKLYHKHMEIQNLDPLWFGQVEDECFPQSSSTNTEKCNISNSSGTGSNLKGKQHKDNMALALNNMRLPHIDYMANSQNTSDITHIEVLINYNINAPIEADA